MPSVKMATCHYCGTRAALILRGQERHELSCANCAAPLHDLKIMPRRDDPQRAVRRAPRPAPSSHARAMSRVEPRRSRRPKKSFMRWAVEELWDVIEDAIEDVID